MQLKCRRLTKQKQKRKGESYAQRVNERFQQPRRVYIHYTVSSVVNENDLDTSHNHPRLVHRRRLQQTGADG